MYNIIRLFTIALILILSACSLRPNYSDEVRDLNPKQVIEYYVEAQNEHNESKIYSTFTGPMLIQTRDYSPEEVVRIISMEEASVYEFSSALSFEEVMVYKVELGVKPDKNSPEEILSIFYCIVKETKDNSWLIYNSKLAQ